jgi:hypothetical protein
MKKYKSQLKEFSKKLFTYKGRNIFDTYHSIDRFHERFPDLSIETWEKVCENGMDVILDVFRDSIGKYIIVSNSTNMAIQLEWRKDKNKSSDKKNHGFTATTLDYRIQKIEIQGDRKLFVEKIKKYGLEEEFAAYLAKKNASDNNSLSINVKDCEGYYSCLYEGMIIKNFEIIEVE